MRCTSCDYPLWNLTARQCPECGTAFRPGEFEFVANSVRFCCPQCDQDYYGTATNGHLVPIEFDCVRCGLHVHMDEMVLRPAEGIEEKDTRTDFNPWLERHRNGRFKSWIKTIGRALFAPGRLMQATPREASLKQAWWFAIVTNLAMMSVGVGFFMLIMLVFGLAGAFQGGPGVPNLLTIAGTVTGAVVVFAMLFTLIAIGIWGAIAHVILMMTGKLDGGIGRTYQAMCYSSGANVASVVLIFCGGQYVGWIWWVVSAIIMLKTVHGVHGGRSSLAVLTLPVLFIVGVIGFYTYLFAGLFSQQMAVGTAQISTGFDTTVLTSGVMTYAREHNGAGPAHALELVSRGDASATNFVPFSGGTQSKRPLYPGTGRTFSQYMFAPDDEQEGIAEFAVDAMPAELVAHRVGDYVFTYHGLDLNAVDPGMWIVILAPIDRAPGFGLKATSFDVGMSDGSTLTFSLDVFYDTELAAQNLLRADAGMPPLPDPLTVMPAKPAVANGEVEEP